MSRDIMASLPAQQMQTIDRRKSSTSSSARHQPRSMRTSVDTSDVDESDADNRRLFHQSAATATAPTTTSNTTTHQTTPSLLRQRNTSNRSPFSVLNNVSLSLENTGSVARDHLANERTYLAWLRTSLSFASIGVAVAQLFSLNQAIGGGTGNGSEMLRRFGQPLGATFIGVAIIVLLLGVKRYFSAQSWMTRGKFPASRGSVGLLSAIALLVSQLALYETFLTSFQAYCCRFHHCPHHKANVVI